MKITQPVTSLRIITFRKGFINLKCNQNITLKYLGLDVKHSLRTCKCTWFQLFYIIICYEVSNLCSKVEHPDNEKELQQFYQEVKLLI